MMSTPFPMPPEVSSAMKMWRYSPSSQRSQLQPAGPYDTRMRLVLHAELNMMMRMMIGGKLQKALDQIAEAMAKAMNGSAM
jgi:carbon monoxide dehydrogenase subunit G